MPKFFSDAHLSGSSTDLTLDGQLFLPSTTSDPGAAVPISFDSGAGGIWYDSNDDHLWFRAGNSKRAYVSSAGIISQANVYTGTSNSFRNYAGAWQASTGLTGNGFSFVNSVDGTAMTLSSTGNAVFTGDVTATKLKMGNTQLYKSGDNNHIHFIGTAFIGTSTTASSNPKIGTSTYPFSQVHAGYFYGDGSNLTNVTANAPSNMVTTNTTQTISGTKTFSSDITLDDGSGESPHIIFQDDDDIKFRVYNADNNDFYITREGNSGPDFVVKADSSAYTSSYLQIGGSTVSPTKISQWNTAYGWGNHASANYVTTNTAQTISGNKTLTFNLL